VKEKNMEDNTVIVGVFDERTQADQAMWDLQKAGFRDIGCVEREDMSTQYLPSLANGKEEAEKQQHQTATGVVAGGIAGGVIGAVVAWLFTGPGSVFVGGIISTLLGGAALGAVIGGMFGKLKSSGMFEERAHHGEEEEHAGHTIVIVQADERALEAFHIMEQHQPVNKGDYVHLSGMKNDPEATVEMDVLDSDSE
jgi:hypothetical protein